MDTKPTFREERSSKPAPRQNSWDLFENIVNTNAPEDKTFPSPLVSPTTPADGWAQAPDLAEELEFMNKPGPEVKSDDDLTTGQTVDLGKYIQDSSLDDNTVPTSNTEAQISALGTRPPTPDTKLMDGSHENVMKYAEELKVKRSYDKKVADIKAGSSFETTPQETTEDNAAVNSDKVETTWSPDTLDNKPTTWSPLADTNNGGKQSEPNYEQCL